MANATKKPPVEPSIILELTHDEALAILLLTGRAVTGTGPIGRASETVFVALEDLLEGSGDATYLNGNVQFLA